MDILYRIILLTLVSGQLIGQVYGPKQEITSSFSLKAAIPLDARSQINKLADTSLIVATEGLITYVRNIDLHFYYDGESWEIFNPPIDSTGIAALGFEAVDPVLTDDGSYVYYNGGLNFGIGTATPSYPLHVQGNSAYLPSIVARSTSGDVHKWARMDIHNDLGGGALVIYQDTFGVGDIRNFSTENGDINFASDEGGYKRNMTISATDGNVGIGTTTPSASLEVEGTSGATNLTARFGALGLQNYTNTNNFLTFNSYYDGTSPRALYDGGGVWIQVSSGKMFFRNSPSVLAGEVQQNNIQMVIETSGNVGIGTTTPTEKLDVNGNARIRSIASGAYSAPVNQEADGTLTTSTSDSLLKRAIKPIKSNKALDQILLMQGVTYKWKPNLEKVGRIRDLKEQREAFRDSLEVMYITDSIALKTKKFKKITVQDTAYFGDSILINSRIITAEEQRKEYRATMREKQKETKKQIKTHISEIKESIHHEKIVSDSYNVKRLGVIAQQIQQVAPELVFQNQDGYLGVRYTEIIPLLIEGMKAQQKTIENLEKRIEKIEKE